MIKINSNTNNSFTFKYIGNEINFYVPKVLYSDNIDHQLYLDFFNHISYDSEFLAQFETLGIQKDIKSQTLLEISSLLNSNQLLKIINSRLTIINLTKDSKFLTDFLDDFNLSPKELSSLEHEIKQIKKYTIEEIEIKFRKLKFKRINEIIDKLKNLSISSNNNNGIQLINEITFLNNGVIFEKVWGYKLLGKPAQFLSNDGINLSSSNKQLSLIVDNYFENQDFRYVVDFKFYKYDSTDTKDLYKQIIYCAYIKNYYRAINNLNVIGVLLYVSNTSQEDLTFHSHIKFIDIEIICLSISNKFILEFRNQHLNFQQQLIEKIENVLKNNNFKTFLLKT